ncbi:hypothetical protein, partial [Klebsiella pneumoniae]|uniref:hypothetical protein n=1 Tax=Klebsiella pneumoniae TaxID=573 RepID=UPI0030139702
PCLNLGENTPVYMSPVKPGSLLSLIQPQPPAEAPSPVLAESDVAEPPFPSVVAKPNTDNDTTAPPPNPPNGQAKVVVGIFLSNLAILLATLLLF